MTERGHRLTRYAEDFVSATDECERPMLMRIGLLDCGHSRYEKALDACIFEMDQ